MKNTLSLNGLRGLSVAGAILLTAALAVAGTAAAQSWTFTGNMNVARLGPTATLLTDGRVLVTGGENVVNGSGPGLDSAETYNPAAGTWTLTPKMTVAHNGASAVRLTDGRVLVCGGRDSSAVPTNICEIYNPVAGTWTQTGSMNVARGFQNAVGLVRLANGKVLAIAGILPSGALTNTAELYDPSTGTWQFTGSVPVSMAGPSATLLPTGQVLVAGGNDCCGTFSNAELYDPIPGLWTPTGFLNQARAQHIGVLLGNGKVLVAGGRTGTGSTCCTPTGTAELYDPISGIWTPTSSMSVARDSHRAVFLNNGQVLVTGGLTAAFSTTLNTTEIYDPGSGTWSAAASMNQARYAHGSALLLDGRILVAGGGIGSNSLNSAEIFSTCSVHGDDVEGDGNEQGDDGHKGHFHFCKGSGDMDFEEHDSGKGMRGSMDAVTISGNQATINGAGTLLDGTPVRYTAIVLGNAPVMGANNFAISWITSTGSSFHTSGALTDGYIVVHTQ